MNNAAASKLLQHKRFTDTNRGLSYLIGTIAKLQSTLFFKSFKIPKK